LLLLLTSRDAKDVATGKKNEGRQAVRQQLKRRLAQAAFFHPAPA